MLLTAIGMLSGAALGADAVRRGLRRVGADFERARLGEEGTAVAVAEHPLVGRKGGAAVVEEPEVQTLPVKNRFGTASIAPERAAPERAAPEATPPTPAAPTPETSQHHTDLKNVHGPFGYLRELFNRFSGDYCAAWAASLSFFAILSIAPILLCGLAVLGFIIHDPARATEQVQHLLANVLPGSASTAQTQAKDIIQEFKVEESVQTLYTQRGVAGIIGVLSLFWAAMQIFVNATTPMNAAFRTRESRNWLKLRLVALGLFISAGGLFLASLLPAYVAQTFRISGFGEVAAPITAVFLMLVGVGVNAIMFALIYRFLPSPSANVTWKAAMMAGGVVAVLWEIAKEAFAFYISRFAHYDKVYGTLGSFIGLIFWIYYTCMILLLGAEIAKLYLDAQETHKKA